MSLLKPLHVMDTLKGFETICARPVIIVFFHDQIVYDMINVAWYAKDQVALKVYGKLCAF